MFIVLLKFSDNKSMAGKFMQQHNDWIKSGFDDEIFLMVGSLQPHAGGGIVAHNISRQELESRINEDPFVAQNIVTAEIIEITPARTDERLNFLINQTAIA